MKSYASSTKWRCRNVHPVLSEPPYVLFLVKKARDNTEIKLAKVNAFLSMLFYTATNC